MSEFDLIVTRRMAAPPARLWRAWTEPELVKQWFAPKPVVTREVVIDLRPGGRFYTLMALPDGMEFPNEGCVLVVEPEKRLICTECLTQGFRPAANPMLMMTMEITLERDGTGTLYTARVMHGDAATRDRHIEMGFHDGWGAATTQLQELAERLDS